MNLNRSERFFTAAPASRWIMSGLFAICGLFMLLTGLRDGFLLGTMIGAAFIAFAILLFFQQRRLYGTGEK